MLFRSVNYAEINRLEGKTATEAALHGAQERLRPILMTSIAMVSGMVASVPDMVVVMVLPFVVNN